MKGGADAPPNHPKTSGIARSDRGFNEGRGRCPAKPGREIYERTYARRFNEGRGRCPAKLDVGSKRDLNMIRLQ